MVEQFWICSVAMPILVTTSLQEADVKGLTTTFWFTRGKISHYTVSGGTGHSVAKGAQRPLGAVDHPLTVLQAEAREKL